MSKYVGTCTWNDVPHLTAEAKAQLWASIPAYQRDARSKGVPQLGSGRIFPVPEEAITVASFRIPSHYKQIGGLDFGWDHPFAAVRLAWDVDNDTVYVTNCYRQREAIPAIHVAALRPWGDWLPWAWPHDGLNTEKGSGDKLAALYRTNGLKMLGERAQYEGDRGSYVEPGLIDMLERMETARFKVFDNLVDWFEEFRLYHRKDGKVVKLRDDLMSATRYALMCLRFAKCGPPKAVMAPISITPSAAHRSTTWLGR